MTPSSSPPDASSPIGVFDSGIGGLTVAHAIMRRLPAERLVYFGDTARVPYGPKSPDTVRRYSREITAYLLGEGVKAIVVACNTATAHALPALQAELPVPVIGVVDPGARAAVAASRSRHIGVIGTEGTINSRAYHRAIDRIAPDARIDGTACPLFVPLIEEGWLDHPATRLVAEEYLGRHRVSGIDTLVLGCTHYPLLKSLLGTVLPGVALIDSAAETAEETARMLAEHGLEAAPESGDRDADDPSPHRFIASDDAEQFLKLSQRFLGRTVERVETRTLG